MNTVVFLGKATDLSQSEEGGEDSMIGEEDIIEVNFASLFIINKIPI